MDLGISTREKALEIVEKVEKEGAFATELLRKASRDPHLNYGLLQRLVKGSIEWQGRLDEIVKKIHTGKHPRLRVGIKRLLRLAAYQFVFLKNIRTDLVYSETVKIARRLGSEPEVRCVQMILKVMSKSGFKEPKTQDLPKTVEEISAFYSHPVWMVKRWFDVLGLRETVCLCDANNKPWPVCVRTNTLRINTHALRQELADEGIRIKPSPSLKDSTLLISVPKELRLTKLSSFVQGLFQVQDESATLVGLMVGPKANETVLDVCAAPGGKATHMATLMRNKGHLIACDSSEGRLKMVQENAERLGVKIIECRTVDATKMSLASLGITGPVDRVLVDAPCSGLGVIGRKGDIRFAREEKAIGELVVLQSQILESAAQFVKPGGRLVYSTCTTETEENEDVVEKFCKKHKEFSVVSAQGRIPDNLVTSQGFMRTWPHRHDMAGAFAAILERSKD